MRFNPCKVVGQASSLSPSPCPPDSLSPKPDRLEACPTSTFTLKSATHTKRQCPIWIAQLTERVERKEFLRLCAQAKSHGGYWSSFGPVDQHGFIFFEETGAVAFAGVPIVGQASSLSATVTVAAMADETSAPIPINIIHLPSADRRDACPTIPAWRAKLLRS